MRVFHPLHLNLTAALAAAVLVAPAIAQSLCSSDGQVAPSVLMERFISADCADCWSDSRTRPARSSELTVDWIVPGAGGEDAPLAAAASRDALQRLQSLRRAVPTESTRLRHVISAKPRSLRVAQGVAVGGYLGTSIALAAAHQGPAGKRTMTAWLLLVEELPAGTEGSAVRRNLVRNALVLDWSGSSRLPRKESRPMQSPDGANPERLRLIGWVEDAAGRILASAATVCGG